MIEISKHALLGSVQEIMLAVEDCGSSPELTHVTTLLLKLMIEADVLVDKVIAFETQTMPHIWKTNTLGLLPYISDEQYQELSDDLQKRYEQYIVNRLPLGCKSAVLQGGVTICKHKKD
jgi:ABC-type antimicrobial peptide transport system permease subunit